jgi:wobble nucleotide-excising tRNase
MLEKINHVKNIGRFYNVSIQGTADSDPSFKKFNLIYADNGTGKSTFSTILKSLWKNDPQRLIEKRTIGCVDESNISIQVGGKTHIFQNGKWNQIPEIAIEIFDEEFVAKNVFSPNGVELENRRELFNYIVLGEENVAKVVEVKKLNDLINGDLKTKIDAETKLKKAAIIQDIKILDSKPELDDNTLKTMRSSVEENNKIITHVERITKEKKLENITDFENISFAEVISADLSSLSFAAEYKTHVQIHNEWIKDGMEILKSEAKESCPFCFQAVKNNSAIATYKTLFSEEYETLRKTLCLQLLILQELIYRNTKSFRRDNLPQTLCT